MASDKELRLAVALNGYGLWRHGPQGAIHEVLPWDDLVAAVETAEETGYEAVFMPETNARETFVSLTGLAARTTEIRLASGVVPLGARDLRTLAMATLSLQDVSGGRFVLGVGSLASIVRTREQLSTLRTLTSGAGADGVVLDIARSLAPEPPPLYLAALGPRMTELAGESADGVILNWCTPERVARAREEVSRGAERAARDPGAVTVAVFVRCCLGHDEEHAVAALAEAAAQYAALPKYRRQLEAMGLGKEAQAAADRSDPELVRSLLDAVAVRGGRDEALDRLAEYRDAGADLVVIYPVPAQDAASSFTGTILAAAPEPALER